MPGSRLRSAVSDAELLVEFAARRGLGDELSPDLVARFLEEYRVAGEELGPGEGQALSRRNPEACQIGAEPRDVIAKIAVSSPLARTRPLTLKPGASWSRTRWTKS